MNVFELFARINLNDTEFNKGLTNAQTRMKNLGERSKRLGQTLSTRLTTPLAAIGGGVIAMSTQFDESMNRLQAITGETGETFDNMRELAQELGSTTQFSASQAADGMGFLAQAGFDTQEIMESIPGALELAAAGQLTLAEAADIATNVLGGFDMDPDQIGRVNDVMAETASIANTNVRQLGEALVLTGSVAAEAGVPVEEVSAAVGALGDVGVQGAEAGTALRNIFTRLGPAAEELGFDIKDAEGNMLSFPEIIGNINDAGIDGEQIMKEFGLRAGPRLLSLLNRGEEGLQDLTNSIENSGGAAQQMAETQMQGLPGAFKELRSAAEGAAIALGDAGISEFIEAIADRVSEAIRAFTNLEEDVQRNVAVIAGLLGAAGPIMIAIGVLTTAIGTITAPIAIVVSAVAAFAAAYATDFMGMRELTNDFVDSILPRLQNLFEAIQDTWQNNVKPAIENLEPSVRNLEDLTRSAFETLASLWNDTLKPAWDEIRPQVMDIADAARQSFTDVARIIEDVFFNVVDFARVGFEGISRTFTSFREQYGDDVLRVVNDVLEFIEVTLTQFADLFEVVAQRAGDVFNGLRDLWQNVLRPAWAEITPFVEKLGSLFEDVLGGSLDVVTGIIQTIIDVLNGDFTSAWNNVQGVVTGVVSVISNAIEGVQTLVQGFFELVLNVLDRLDDITSFELPSFGFGGGGGSADSGAADSGATDAGGGNGGRVPDWVPDWFPGAGDPEDEEPAGVTEEIRIPEEIGLSPSVPQLANGGIVRQPTLALVGEAGPEAVVPLDRLSTGNGDELGNAVGLFGRFVDRLTQEGIRVDVTGGRSRTAAFR